MTIPVIVSVNMMRVRAYFYYRDKKHGGPSPVNDAIPPRWHHGRIMVD